MSDSIRTHTRRYFALLVVALCSTAHRAAIAQTTAEPAPKQTAAEAPAKPTASTFWTCPMHPQIHEEEGGQCPICNMELVQSNKTTAREQTGPLGLQEMLAIALKNNPEVRAADANLRSAEAELDRTRLTVVQKIIAFREKWQTQRIAVREVELALAEEMKQKELADQGAIPSKRIEKILASVTEKLQLEQAKLAEMEAELPFLLGAQPGKAASQPDDKSITLIREKLLPRAQQILQIRTRDLQAGQGTSIADVLAAQREVGELELRAAPTRRQKIDALEKQKKLLQGIRKFADALYKTANASQADVLAADLELSKLELRLLELKGD